MPNILSQPQVDSEIYRLYCAHCFYNVENVCWVLPESVKYKDYPYDSTCWNHLGVCDSLQVPSNVMEELLEKRLTLYGK